MNLYHLTYATDREALQALSNLRSTVHGLGGYIWSSLGFESSLPVLVVALPPDAVFAPVAGKQAVAFLSDFFALHTIDPEGPAPDTAPDMTPVIQAAVDEAAARVVPVETPEEEPADEQLA